jgi:hypothetical protein
MRPLLHALAVACATAALSSPVAAQTIGARQVPLAQSLTGAALDDYTSATMLMKNGDFAGAMSKYGQAYDLAKDPRLLFNMAICARNLHQYARMQKLLEGYRREAASSMTAEDAGEVSQALAAIKNLVGTVKLSVTQPDATVTVDGETIGVTPLAEALVLDLGEHTVVVRKDGFATVEKVIPVSGGSDVLESIALVAQEHIARLVVSAERGATVIIDGREMGQGRFDGQVAPGLHAVSVTAAGQLPYKAEIDVRDGETRMVEVTLESEHRRPIWPWLVGGAALAAGAAIGGYFLFKPQDQATPVPAGKFAPTVMFTSWGR